MMKEYHTRRKLQRNPSGSSGNAGLNSSGELDGKPDNRLCSEKVSWRETAGRKGMLTSITNNEVMVDSGASEHVTGDPTLLNKRIKVPGIEMKLPIGVRVAS